MAYRVDGKDIVISGFEDGVADNPYKGIADLRNVNISSIPGEASVALATQQSSSASVSGTVTATSAGGSTTDTVTTTGTWTAPAGVFRVNVEAFGGGGGAGSGGGGAGGGAYSQKSSIAVVPGTVYTVTVGTGGTAGVAGGDSWFSTTGTILAKGGATSSGVNGGSGGSAGSGVGDVKFSGGTGGTLSGSFSGNQWSGGGGGGNASGAGGNGGGTTGGGNLGGGAGGGGGGNNGGSAGNSNGGVGGNGSSGTGGNSHSNPGTGTGGGGGADFTGVGESHDGGAGGSSGGGGGGATNNGGTGKSGGTGGVLGGGSGGGDNGGVGGRGEVRITYTPNFTLTASSVSGSLYNGRAVTFSGGGLPTGIVAGTVYYIGALSGLVFSLYTKPDIAVANIVLVTTTGTGTFANVPMGKIKDFVQEALSYVQTDTPLSYNYYAVDTNGRVWYYNTNITANSLSTNVWIFLNNSTSTYVGQGIAVWNQYLIIFRAAQMDYIQTYSGSTFTLLSNSWTTNWQPDGANSLNTTNSANRYSHQTLVGADGILYYCDGFYLGSLKLASPSTTFDPANSATYTWSRQALALPNIESTQCLQELGSNLLVGCNSNFIYPWDKVSTSFNLGTIIKVPEPNVVRMLTVNNNTYILAGNRGNIYISNGSQAQLFKKVPDYLSGTVQPYYAWGGFAFGQRTLYFGVIATTNAGGTISQYGGLWAIDMDTSAIRMINKLSYGTYAQIASAVMPILGATNALGYSLWIGWGTGADGSSTGGIDNYSGNPYIGGESIVDSDMIPIGTYLKPFTPSQLEWKISVPLVSGETVALYYRLNSSDSFTLIPSETTSLVGALSDVVKTNFQKAQWAQIRAVLTSTATNPTYARLTEIRIRDYPA